MKRKILFVNARDGRDAEIPLKTIEDSQELPVQPESEQIFEETEIYWHFAAE